MRSSLTFSVVAAAMLFGATAFVSAQAKPAADASTTSSAMASMRHHSMHHHHHYRHHSVGFSRAQMDKSRPGGRPISRKPAD